LVTINLASISLRANATDPRLICARMNNKIARKSPQSHRSFINNSSSLCGLMASA